MPMVERCKKVPWLGNQYCYYTGNKYSNNHTCYQETWCSNQKTKIFIIYFHFEILDEEEDVMFVTKLDLF